jgi:hypothetical protein
MGGRIRWKIRKDWNLARRVIDQSRVKRAINRLKPFKLAGTDGKVPALLQHDAEHLVSNLGYIFRACLTYGKTLRAWRQTTVTFIPKPGKASKIEAEACCPMSLSSFSKRKKKKKMENWKTDKK